MRGGREGRKMTEEKRIDVSGRIYESLIICVLAHPLLLKKNGEKRKKRKRERKKKKKRGEREKKIMRLYIYIFLFYHLCTYMDVPMRLY